MERQPLPNESDQIASLAPHGLTEGGTKSRAIVNRFSHLVIHVTDLDRSETWYRDVMGMDIMGRNLTAEPTPHSVLKMNTGQLFILVQSQDVEHRAESRRFIHHAFLLTPNQYRRAYERLKEHGYEIFDVRLHLRPFGEYSMNVVDPDGHRYQIQTHAAEPIEVIYPTVGVVDCGSIDNYSVGEVKTFKDGHFFLVRLPEGFLALNRWCTHRNGTVVYEKAHWRFVCPLHGATYDRRGLVTGSPAPCPLRLNPITFSTDGRVLVDTDNVIERTSFTLEQVVRPPETADGH